MVAFMAMGVGGGVVACGGLRHRGVTRIPDEGAAEGVEDVAHEGCMCCSCFVFGVDGEGHMSHRRGSGSLGWGDLPVRVAA